MERLHHLGISCVTESVLFALGTPSSIFNENTILSRGLSGQMSQLHVCGFGMLRGTDQIIAPFWLFLFHKVTVFQPGHIQ